MAQSGPGFAASAGARLLAALLAVVAAGCRTPPLQSARENYQLGRFRQAETNLVEIPADDKDEILYLMERGMIRQALRHYDDSSADWRRAADKDQQLETYSLSQGAASLLVNDRTQSFRGQLFERVLLFACLAKNYLAQSNWDFAAICARNIISRLDQRGDFPDIPYARYVAGFCLETINDHGNAAIQFRAVNKLLPDIGLDPQTGRFRPADTNAPPPPAAWTNELVCFLLSGRIPDGVASAAAPPAMEHTGARLYAGEDFLGYGVPLADTAALLALTEQQLAVQKVAKTAARVALKVGVSEAVKQQNEALGFLTELLLFAMEQPDTRRWETLPRRLEAVRLPCPADLQEIRVEFASGRTVVTRPASRRGHTYIALCRDNER